MFKGRQAFQDIMGGKCLELDATAAVLNPEFFEKKLIREQPSVFRGTSYSYTQFRLLVSLEIQEEYLFVDGWFDIATSK